MYCQIKISVVEDSLMLLFKRKEKSEKIQMKKNLKRVSKKFERDWCRSRSSGVSDIAGDPVLSFCHYRCHQKPLFFCRNSRYN